jgi:ATP-dependent Clp protease ATP-binding subunit ClpA
LLTQEALSQYHTEKCKLSVLLFDEIEKSSDTLWNLLLGIMDKATLTLGDNRVVNFNQVIVVLTSNLGASEMSKVGIGYRSTIESIPDSKIRDVAISAAKRKFTPEFMNRIDHTVVFNTLTPKDIWTIMAIELGKAQQIVFNASRTFFYLEPEARETIFNEGHSKEYGARAMKRTIEKRVSIPMARLLASNQVAEGETVVISKVSEGDFEYSVGGGKKGNDIRVPASQIEGDNAL